MRLPGFDKINSSHFLRITFFAGLILFVLAAGVFSVFYIAQRISTRTERQKENFNRILREYDISVSEIFGTEREFEYLNRELDNLEKLTIGLESWLSVLKRRRNIAFIHPASMEKYNASINNALKTFPLAEPVLALAAEASIKNKAINRETEQKLRLWLSQINDPSFNSVRLGLHILLGDFRNPQRAAFIPANLVSDGTESIFVNLVILKIQRGNIRDAAADISSMLFFTLPSDDALRFAAEFHYDFGDLLRSAEIFSLINDEKAMIRQADALYLAGFQDIARSIWNIFADERSLYNLSVTASHNEEAVFYLERMTNIVSETESQNMPAADARQFGVIRYSRLFDTPQAIAVLQNTEGISANQLPYIDLEICRRQAQMQELGRQMAEAWLLLDRHPEDEELYHWAAWLFLFQRNYSEIKILLNRVENLNFESTWAKVYRAIELMFEGNLETAEELLRSIPEQQANWPVYANLGRIFETERSPARALEQYELAAEKSDNPKTTAGLYLRISRCFYALNRPAEAYSALLYAHELDPDNLSVRLEIDRASPL